MFGVFLVEGLFLVDGLFLDVERDRVLARGLLWAPVDFISLEH
jgi:hypothetical protein